MIHNKNMGRRKLTEEEKTQRQRAREENDETLNKRHAAFFQELISWADDDALVSNNNNQGDVLRRLDKLGLKPEERYQILKRSSSCRFKDAAGLDDGEGWELLETLVSEKEAEIQRANAAKQEVAEEIFEYLRRVA